MNLLPFEMTKQDGGCSNKDSQVPSKHASSRQLPGLPRPAGVGGLTPRHVPEALSPADTHSGHSLLPGREAALAWASLAQRFVWAAKQPLGNAALGTARKRWSSHLNLGSLLPRACALNHCAEPCELELLGPVLHQLRAAVLILCLAGASSQKASG